MLEWWHRLAYPLKVVGAISILTGAIVGVSQALPIVEPYWYVTRGAFRLVMDKQAIATDRQTLFQLQEYLTRAQSDPAAGSSPTVQERIQNLKDQIDQTKKRIDKATVGVGG